MTFLILVIGDLHIPDRALDIPAKVNAQNKEACQLGPTLYPREERSVVTEFDDVAVC
jgi:hypothetical protein